MPTLLQNLADQSAGRREVERKALLAALQTALQSLLTSRAKGLDLRLAH